MLKITNLYQSALGKLRVSRMGGLTMLVVDGQGLALCLTADFSAVEKWAKSKQPGPNATIDMGKMLEKIDVMVCRPGTTFGTTRGSTKPLESIVKGIKSAGMDPKEFSLPPELKDTGPVDEVAAAKEAAERKKAADAAKLGQPLPTGPVPVVPPPAPPSGAPTLTVPLAPRPAPAGPPTLTVPLAPKPQSAPADPDFFIRTLEKPK